MQNVYLRNSSSSKRQSVKVGPRFAGGGAGDIHRLPDVPGEVLKLYKTEIDRNLYAPKLEAMLEGTPKLPSSKSTGKNFRQLAWPVSIAEDSKHQFLGFTMPEIDFEGSVSLERMLQKRMRQVSGLPKFYGHRFLAAYNLAVSVAALHKNGHYIIDLKPVNCRLHPDKMLISILDCDGFSIDGGSGKRFHANQFTPEYIAPEASQNKPEELGEKQDLFALAVIIFRLLNNGLHPFQGHLPKGVNGGTIQEMINANYYAYGSKSSPKCSPAKQSIHESFPDDLRKMFDQAFERSIRPKAAKWRDVLREYGDPSSGKLIRCIKNPEEHAYFDNDKGCGWCSLEEAKQRPTVGKTRSRNKTASSTLPSGGTVPLSTLSSIQGRTFLILTILSALSLFFISNLFDDIVLQVPNGVKEAQTPTVNAKKTTTYNPEHLKRLRGTKECPNCDLRGADLEGANLRDANLYRANLRDANLYRANLRDANLKGANLKGANLKGANLIGANLMSAKLQGANLRDANLYSDKIVEINGLGFVTSNTNLRSGAGTNFKVILTLPKGTEIEVLGKVEGRNWYMVKLTSQSGPEKINIRGYVKGSLLALLK